MRYLFLFLTCSLLLCSREVFASFEGGRQGAASLAMGGACSTLGDNPFTAFCNPVSPAMLHADAAGVAYAFPFGQSGISTVQGAFAIRALPFDAHGGAAITYERFGNEHYRESTALFSYATALADWLYAGIGAAYMQRSIPGYGNDAAAGIHTGLAVSSGKAAFDIAVMNLNTPSIGDHGETLPARTTAGFSCKPQENLLFSARIDHRRDRDPTWRFGGQAAILEYLLLRAGVTGNPSTVAAGAGLQLDGVSADVAVSRNPDFDDTATALSIRISL